VNFCDYWSNHRIEDDWLFKTLGRHYEMEISERPDFLFCSVFGNRHFRHRDCVKIFWTGENTTPNFNFYDYALGFDYIEFEDRYMRLPLYALACNMEPRILKQFSEGKSREEMLGRKFCNFVYSNRRAKARTDFFEKLSRYKRVDSGGRFMNNVGGPCADKCEFQSKYKFSIAFENSESNGYTTEKIIDAFKAGTIPIYWGNPRVSEEINPGSFINYYDYGSLDKLMERVVEVDQNEELYMAMLHASPFASGRFARGLSQERLDEFLINIVENGTRRSIKRKTLWRNEKPDMIREYMSQLCSRLGMNRR